MDFYLENYLIKGEIKMKCPKYHIFVCTSCRINGTQQGFCHKNGSIEIVEKFIEEVE